MGHDPSDGIASGRQESPNLACSSRFGLDRQGRTAWDNRARFASGLAGSLARMSDLPASDAVPDDATDTRGAHFNELLRRPTTMVAVCIVVLVAVLVLGSAGGTALGLAGAVAGVIFLLAGVWYLATRQARGDFLRAYAKGRSLAWSDGRTRLPPVTPLLRKGDRRYAEQCFEGALVGGLTGRLALYTYEEDSGSGKSRNTSYHHHTLVITDLPETAMLVRELLCHRRSGPRLLDSAEDVFRRHHRVEVESEAADRRYEIFAAEDDDPIVARQLFEPSFIVWLTEGAPDEFAFELVAGSLVAGVEGHEQTAAGLDEVCRAAAVVAARLRDEAAE
jgi:hypothetical protein